jgi:hypothetical protein
MNNNNSTRDLSVAEYFLQVQKEYLIADFRRKIYFSRKDKAYWTKVCGYKEVRINAIAQRNNLNSIFNSETKLNEIRSELFDRNGKPKFELTKIDIENYYSNGNEFSYKGEIYILDQLGEDGKLTLYSPTSEEYIKVGKDEVSRIL